MGMEDQMSGEARTPMKEARELPRKKNDTAQNAHRTPHRVVCVRAVSLASAQMHTVHSVQDVQDVQGRDANENSATQVGN